MRSMTTSALCLMLCLLTACEKENKIDILDSGTDPDSSIVPLDSSTTSSDSALQDSSIVPLDSSTTSSDGALQDSSIVPLDSSTEVDAGPDGGQPIYANVLLQDDFESPTWSYNDHWGIITMNNWVRTEEDARPGSSGTHSIRGNSAIYTGSQGNGTWLGTNLGLAGPEVEFFVEAWVKFQQGWVRPCASATSCPCPTAGSGTAYSNLFRVQPVTGSGPYIEIDFTHSASSLWIAMAGSGWTGSTFNNPWPFTYGDWHKVNVHIGFYHSGGFLRLWVDKATPTPANADISGDGLTFGDWYHFRMFYYAKRCAEDNSDNGEFWVDDVTIWDGNPYVP